MQNDIERIYDQIKGESDIFNKARLLLFLRKEKDIPLKTIGQKLGFKPSFLCHLLRLNRIPDIISDGYYSNLITISHLFILSRIKDTNKMIGLYEKILSDSPSVNDTQQLVREAIYGIKTTQGYLSNKEKEELTQRIQKNRKDIKVNIIQTRIKSKLIIEITGDLAKTGNLLKSLF